MPLRPYAKVLRPYAKASWPHRENAGLLTCPQSFDASSSTHCYSANPPKFKLKKYVGSIVENAFPYAVLNSQKCIPSSTVQVHLDLTPIPARQYIVVSDHIEVFISTANCSVSSFLKSVYHME